MNNDKEKYGVIDWVGSIIGIVVAGFIIFILIFEFFMRAHVVKLYRDFVYLSRRTSWLFSESG